MIVKPVIIPKLSKTVSSFEEAKNIILENLSKKETELPQGADSDLYKVFKKYYSKIINKKILKKSPYPLDCKLIRDLFFKFEAKDINEFGDKLKAIEKAHGKDFLDNIFEEARGEKGVELTQKLSSLQAEINCAYLLAPFGTLKKLIDVKGCDFIFQYDDERWCIQVKRKNDEYFNLCLIANAISSELFIENNNVIRKFNGVVFEGENIDKDFRKEIVTFFHSSTFIESLISCEKYSAENHEFYYHEIKCPIQSNYGTESGMKVNICGNEKWVSFIFEFKDKKTKIEFKKSNRINNFQHYGLKNPMFHPEEENLKIDKLNNLLGDIFVIAQQKFRSPLINKKALFIQLDISPQNEENFKSCVHLIKNLMEEKIYPIPCLIFPSTRFEKFKPIINQAAEDSSLGRMIQNLDTQRN